MAYLQASSAASAGRRRRASEISSIRAARVAGATPSAMVAAEAAARLDHGGQARTAALPPILIMDQAAAALMAGRPQRARTRRAAQPEPVALELAELDLEPPESVEPDRQAAVEAAGPWEA